METQKTLHERQSELQRLCKKAVDTGEPVWIGMWGPTGHALYITAKAPVSNGAGIVLTGDSDEPR